MIRRISAIVGVLCVGGATPVTAQTLVDSYVAFLSKADHQNSRGTRLKTAAGIIRQDRANYHRYNRRDLQDEGDRFFASKDNRAQLEKMLKGISKTSSAYKKIVNGTPIVRVQVYKRDNGRYVVRVGVKK